MPNPETDWTRIPAEDLEPGVLRTFKHAGKQLVVGRTEDGRPFALDNRCPHEGYPLASGTLKGEALTCCWHNWKFDVRGGACLLGGEPVRSYAVRESGGTVEVDLADPDPELLLPGFLDSLGKGLSDHDMGRTLRDVVRILRTGWEPRRVLAEIAAWDAEHAEYGTTHALPVAADCARLVERFPGSRATIAIAPAADMAGEANRRLPRRAQPAPAEVTSLDAFRRAVEDEEVERAEALFLGAFETGLDGRTLEDWLYTVIADHFLDFGHALIYLVKSQELLSGVDPGYARRVLPALAYGVVLGTREDTLPYWEPYSRRFRALDPRLEELWEGTSRRARWDREALFAAALDGSPAEACDALVRVLEVGAEPEEVAEVLVLAAAERLWRFDDALDRDRDVLENWLWATHRFTFASAVRCAIRRFRQPAALRFLFQALAFVHSGRRMDRASHERPAPRDGGLPGVLGALAARDADGACAHLAGALRDGLDPRDLEAPVLDLCLDDPVVRPIVVAHAIKTATAAFEEYQALARHPNRDVVLFAGVRFLGSPVVERRVRETAERSIRWVDEGIMPRKLTQ